MEPNKIFTFSPYLFASEEDGEIDCRVVFARCRGERGIVGTRVEARMWTAEDSREEWDGTGS